METSGSFQGIYIHISLSLSMISLFVLMCLINVVFVILKYIVIAPWAINNSYSYLTSSKEERDLSGFLIFPFLLFRMLHNQLWISLSRYKTAKGTNRIVDKSIDFEQVDRERDWLVFSVLHSFF